jgi:hypothetical protein
MSRLINVKDD